MTVKSPGRWNLEAKDGGSGREIDPSCPSLQGMMKSLVWALITSVALDANDMVQKCAGAPHC